MKYYVQDSLIHGKGLFSARVIHPGEEVGTFEGVPTDRDGMYVLWVENEDGDYRPYYIKNCIKYANHSDNPNAETDGFKLLALKTIMPNEEITFHYGEDW